MTLGKNEEVVKYFIRSMCIDNLKVNMIMEQVENILVNGFSREKFNEIKEEIFQLFSAYQKAFQKFSNKVNYVGKIFDIKYESYGVGIYDNYFAERKGPLKDFDLKLHMMYKLYLFNCKKLKIYKIKVQNLNDGNESKYFSGEREYTYPESIFPKSPYRATINDLTHKFSFETKEECQVDGRFKIDGYKFQLINKETDEDETELFREKVEKYLQAIFEHIKEYIII